MKWAFGSCQANNTDLDSAYPSSPPQTPIQLAWTDLMTYAQPDKLWGVGDFAYRGGSLAVPGADLALALACYTKQFTDETSVTALSVMRQARALVVNDLIGDDHDFSANNGESGDGGTPNDSAARQLNIQALLAGFGMYPYVLQGSPPSAVRGLYGAYNISPRIRVVILDGETLDRSPGTDPDTLSKTFLGGPQDAWVTGLFETPSDTVLTIIICGKSWLGPRQDPPSDPDGEDADKPWSYSVWRRNFFAALVRDTHTNAVYLGGDRHGLGYAPADMSAGSYHPFPVWLGSAWAEHSLPSRPANRYGPSELSQFQYTNGFDLGHTVYNYQYLLGAVSDDNNGQVSFTGNGRIVDKHASTDPTLWTMKDWLPTPAGIGDVWRY